MKKSAALLLAAVMLIMACAISEVATPDNATPSETRELTREELIKALDEARATIDALREELDAYQNPEIVARFNGGSIRAEEVITQFNEIAQLYDQFYGYDLTLDPEECASIQADIILSIATDMIVKSKLSEANITLLTDEELADLYEEAVRAHQQLIEENMAYFRFADMSEDDVRRETKQFLENNGYNADTLYEEYVAMAEQEAIISYIAGEISLTEAQIEEAYQMLLQSDEDFYTFSPEEYEYEAMFGEAYSAWIPEGYRRVRILLLAFTDEQLDEVEKLRVQLNESKSEADIARVNSEIEAYYQALAPRADDVRARLESGEEFFDILLEVGDDPTMAQAPYSRQGYCIYKDSNYFDEAIAQAAMALENTGDVSDAVRTDYGLNFIEYLAPVAAGPVPLENIREQVIDGALEAIKYERYRQTVDAWVEEAKLTYYLERLN